MITYRGKQYRSLKVGEVIKRGDLISTEEDEMADDDYLDASSFEGEVFDESLSRIIRECEEPSKEKLINTARALADFCSD
jgi:hypothetical protein